ncbi:type II CAAX endopeptidase family protein [Kutzneria viridogrisea]|uniref:CAAX prenyl protease 2/Lysostaphin resistance protein A-like domain-containing protein n=1 Tax=Kutzneria viridogrisea TaxID=47990 RepID=A0ABR6BBQ7_9PSEU|nr:hypothetical protein [Kutzneria viridogrisea]
MAQEVSGGGRAAGLGRAVVGAGVVALALGAGTGIGTAVTDALGITGFGARLLPALLCSSIAVPLVLVLRVRWDHRSLTGIGLTGPRESMAALLLGVVVTGGSAAAVLGAGTTIGWVRWGPLDLTALLAFVLTNGVIALLLEALPEEVTLRGYAWTSLRERHRAVLATLLTTALFLAIPGAASVVSAAVTAVLGGGPSPIGIAPAGEDPFSYLVLLTVFGLTLVAARTATSSASLWTCVGTHLTFLTINRVTLFGQQRGAGWSAEFTTPDAVLLIPAYLIVAALTYLTVAHLRRRRSR